MNEGNNQLFLRRDGRPRPRAPLRFQMQNPRLLRDLTFSRIALQTSTYIYIHVKLDNGNFPLNKMAVLRL